MPSGAHPFDSCSPVFPVETLQYCISQMILQHHLNDIKCLLVSEHDSEGGFELAHLFLWRIYPELVLLETTGSFWRNNPGICESIMKGLCQKNCPYKGHDISMRPDTSCPPLYPDKSPEMPSWLNLTTLSSQAVVGKLFL